MTPQAKMQEITQVGRYLLNAFSKELPHCGVFFIITGPCNTLAGESIYTPVFTNLPTSEAIILCERILDMMKTGVMLQGPPPNPAN